MLPEPIRGVITSVISILNLVFWCTPFYVLALLKLLPIPALKRACFRGLEYLATRWIDGNNALAAANGTRFDVRGTDNLTYEDWYLIGTNHVSWVDVFALQKAFNHKIPFLRFFLKRQLIYVPLLGLAWWALELPFMTRHSRKEVEANPALRETDIAATRRACEPFRERPTSIINFLEGTRFRPEKHARQKSPYTNLLKPKVGGIAYAIEAIGQKMNTFLDVTLVYSTDNTSLWDLMTGRLQRIVVHVEKHVIPDDLMVGDYSADADYRARFKVWVEALWREKDARIDALRLELAQAAP
ncbi:MAG: acyltransferase [Gammaproteobacteria bacterium]